MARLLDNTEPLEKVFGILFELAKDLFSAFGELGEALGLMDSETDGAKMAMEGLATALQIILTPLELVIKGVTALIGWVSDLVNWFRQLGETAPGLANFFNSIWEGIMRIFEPIRMVVGYVRELLGLVGEEGSAAMDEAKAKADAVVADLKAKFDAGEISQDNIFTELENQAEIFAQKAEESLARVREAQDDASLTSQQRAEIEQLFTEEARLNSLIAENIRNAKSVFQQPSAAGGGIAPTAPTPTTSYSPQQIEQAQRDLTDLRLRLMQDGLEKELAMLARARDKTLDEIGQDGIKEIAGQ